MYSEVCVRVCLLKGDLFLIFSVLYLDLLHLPPLRFHCVGGCWDRNHDSCDFVCVCCNLQGTQSRQFQCTNHQQLLKEPGTLSTCHIAMGYDIEWRDETSPYVPSRNVFTGFLRFIVPETNVSWKVKRGDRSPLSQYLSVIDEHTAPKIRFIYSHKWSCTASFPIPTFMYIWAIYIFPGSVCIFGCSKIGKPILGIYTVNRSHIHEWGNYNYNYNYNSVLKITRPRSFNFWEYINRNQTFILDSHWPFIWNAEQEVDRNCPNLSRRVSSCLASSQVPMFPWKSSLTMGTIL